MTGAAGDPLIGVNPASGVVFGVLLKDKVGSAPGKLVFAAVPAAAVGKTRVDRESGVSVGAGVLEGAASAV